MNSGMRSTVPISRQHLERRFVGAAMRRAPQAGDAGGDAGERIGARRAGEPHRRGRGVLLVVGVQDEDAVHGARQHRVDLVLLARHRKAHAQEVGGVVELVLRINEGLADRIFVGHRGDRRHLGDHADRGDHALVRIGDVGGVVIEGRQRADAAAHHRHRMRVAAEARGRTGSSARAPSCGASRGSRNRPSAPCVGSSP